MSQTVSQRIGLSVAPERLLLAPGGRAELAVLVTNQGPMVDTFDLLVEGLDPAWYALSIPSVSLFPGSSDTLGLSLSPPGPDEPSGAPGDPQRGVTAPAGEYHLRLEIRSPDEAGAVATAGVTLEVLPVGALSLSLTPRQATLGGLRAVAGWGGWGGWGGGAVAQRGGLLAGWGRFRVRLDNQGNGERLVDLAVADVEGALETRLGADRLAVPAGEAREVALAARPRRRPWVARARTVPFTVTALTAMTPDAGGALPAGLNAPGELLGSASGALLYAPPLAFLTALPLGLRRLLTVLVPLALLLPVLAWLLGGAGMQSPLRPRPAPAPQAGSAGGAPGSGSFPAAQAIQGTAAAQQTSVALLAGPAGGAGAGGAGAQGAAQQTAVAAAGQVPQIGRFELRAPQGGGRGEFTHRPLFESWAPVRKVALWTAGILVLLLLISIVIPEGFSQQLTFRSQVAWARACGTVLYRLPFAGPHLGCAPGVPPTLDSRCDFGLGFKEFAEQDRPLVGTRISRVGYDRFGNGLQYTDRGVLFWQKDSNTVFFFLADSVWTNLEGKPQLLHGSGRR